MLNLAPPKIQNAPTEQRPWNSYKLVPGELAYDWRNKRLVRLSNELPVEVLRESRNHILHPNWEWKVEDVVTGRQYKRTEFNLIGASEILSWGHNPRKKRISVEFRWRGNRISIVQPYDEIFKFFEQELGEKCANSQAAAKS